MLQQLPDVRDISKRYELYQLEMQKKFEEEKDLIRQEDEIMQKCDLTKSETLPVESQTEDKVLEKPEFIRFESMPLPSKETSSDLGKESKMKSTETVSLDII